MLTRTMMCCSVIGLALLFGGAQIRAEEAGPGSVGFIISHAKELSLTQKQKTQLHELAKEVRNGGDLPAQRAAREKDYADGVASILSADQLAKLKVFCDQSAGKSRKGETPAK